MMLRPITRTATVLALAAASAACGGTDDTAATSVDTEPPATEPAATASTVESEPEPDAGDEPGGSADSDPDTAPVEDAPADVAAMAAPEQLGDAVLPTDADGVVALFDLLPDELLDGHKQLRVNARPGELAVEYPGPDRATPTGIQAFDLPASFFGQFTAEPTADQLVAFFAEGHDWDVEGTGSEGERHWVLWNTTASGVGIDGVELISTLTFGDAGSAWAFFVSGPEPAGRDELLAAFVAASAAVPEPVPPTPDELAAEAVLLTVDDLGAGWMRQPRLPANGAFSEVLSATMANEPSCARALESIRLDDLAISGLFDLVGAGASVRVDGPTLRSERDPWSYVEQTVFVFEDAATVARQFRSTRELGWEECVIAVYPDLAEGMWGAVLPDVEVDVDRASARSLDLGDDSVGLSFELTVRAPDGWSPPITQDVAVVVAGRAVSALVVQDFDDGIDDEHVAQIIAMSFEGLAAQFGGQEASS